MLSGTSQTEGEENQVLSHHTGTDTQMQNIWMVARWEEVWEDG